MINLRRMREEEFPAYSEYFIEDYSQEIARNYGHPISTAIELARKDLENSFPNGYELNGHELLCIELKDSDEKNAVGYLWHSVNTNDNSTFIYDFYIADSFRGQGLGKLAMQYLEDQLQAKGIEQVKLRVAYQNTRALKLYQETGFSITGFNMSKSLV
ncbi:GNAT family N-acetyltransferase [Vibrio makurazakiensis]|uniref:GNAT family N-acetyltransferase n=1 Tax=Vibrio makurazakiensis TaxID=2910250 RepID=UPI003D1265D3